MMERGTWCMREVERGRWRDETEDLTGSGAAPVTDLGPWLSLGHLSVSYYGIGNVYGGWALAQTAKFVSEISTYVPP